jgi:hypothetical protein
MRHRGGRTVAFFEGGILLYMVKIFLGRRLLFCLYFLFCGSPGASSLSISVKSLKMKYASPGPFFE